MPKPVNLILNPPKVNQTNLLMINLDLISMTHYLHYQMSCRYFSGSYYLKFLP